MSLFDPKKLTFIMLGIRAVTIVKTVSFLIAALSLIAVITPTKKDDVFMAKVRHFWISNIRKIAELAGCNYDIKEDPTHVFEQVEGQIEGKLATDTKTKKPINAAQ